MPAPEYNNIQQYRINDHGELEPMTWDGEPLLSHETVRESTVEQLFNISAFSQIRGQIALEDDES